MRYRVEIYDANKAHDLTIYSEENLNRNSLTRLVKDNLNRFQGNIKAYVFDTNQNKKIFAAFFPENIHNLI
jgi:hypothetical protein